MLTFEYVRTWLYKSLCPVLCNGILFLFLLLLSSLRMWTESLQKVRPVLCLLNSWTLLKLPEVVCQNDCTHSEQLMFRRQDTSSSKRGTNEASSVRAGNLYLCQASHSFSKVLKCVMPCNPRDFWRKCIIWTFFSWPSGWIMGLKLSWSPWWMILRGLLTRVIHSSDPLRSQPFSAQGRLPAAKKVWGPPCSGQAMWWAGPYIGPIPTLFPRSR